ncbi:MAG: lamin tail domain-containing protein, partial [Gammaproteobacteria bacterium]|nr:lamin tail domain-containing protein [Gammaproteobacteria bacterium]
MGIGDSADAPKFVFPANTLIPAGGYLLLFAGDADGTSGTHLGFSLAVEGEGVFLFDAGAAVVDSVEFGPQIPDLSVGRTGHDAAWGLNLPTPGAANVAQPTGFTAGLVVNEWLASNDLTYDRDFIEIYNPSPVPVSLAGLYLTDDLGANPLKYQIPALSFVAASGFAVFEPNGGSGRNNASFHLSKFSEGVALLGSGGALIDQVLFYSQQDDVSQGRATDGAEIFAFFALPTPGFSNGTDLTAEAAILASLRITEIMYNPAAGSDTEFIELRNIGAQSINLAGVQFSNGIAFQFPDINLGPGQYIVVVENQAAFEAVYGAGLNVAGVYSGALSNGGENLRLEIGALSAGILDFSYDDGWYPETDGAGYSLVIRDDTLDRSLWGEASSWVPSGTAGGSPGAAGGANPYAIWAAANFSSSDPLVIGMGADPDRDGISNALEFALGLRPLSFDAGPQYSVENGYLVVTYTESISAAATVQIVPEVSDGLSVWQSGPAFVTREVLGEAGDIRTVKATDVRLIGDGPRRFMHVRVTF